MLNACSYHVATQPDAATPLLGGLADLLEFSRNYLINTSYSSTRKLSPKPTGFPKVIILTVIYFYNKLTNRTPSPFAFCVIFIILLGGTM